MNKDKQKITIKVTKILDRTPSITVEDSNGTLIDWKCSKYISDRVKDIIRHSNLKRL